MNPHLRLSGKKALITAAGQGIGKATALLFAEQGASVYACDINDEALAQLTGVENLTPVKLDVTDTGAIADFISKHSDFDILFNCAGYVAHGSILECGIRDWQFSFDLNVSSMYHLTKAILPHMIKNGGGSIVNMSSIASSLKGVPNRFAYCATKGAVIGLTKSIAADFVKQNIRCNAICPGTVDSPSLHERLKATGDYDKAMQDFIARQPLGRIAQAEEIANLALYLASDESAFVTGQTHTIDGGWST